jgi:hypothetical protein
MSRSESGSIIPIGIGVIALSLAISLVVVELIGVQYQTLQTKQLADVIALQVASDLNRDGIAPISGLDYSPVVRATLAKAAYQLGIVPVEVSVNSPDQKTILGVVCTRWISITGFQSDLFGNVCSSSKARATSSASQ